MLFLLLLYFASQSWATEVPRDSNYTLKYVSSCPDAGYFFKREPALNDLAAPCYLCFCQGRNTAVCWPRENRKCDLQHYRHNSSIAKKENRVKRSPLGFGDIFFKDAARSVFNKAEPETCKPYESSFSEGCPPVDWCTGCTVCDCDADGHWDCHILSFCDDEKGKGKKHGQKGRNPELKYPKPRKSGSSKLSKKKANIAKTTKPNLPTKTTTKRPPYKRLQNGPSKATKQRSLIQKGKPVKPLIIKKNEKNPKVVKSSPSKKVLNGSETQLDEEVMKTMMAAMQRMWTKQVTAALPDIVRMVQKRSFSNRSQSKNGNTPIKYKKMTPTKKAAKTHSYNKSLFVRKQKRLAEKKEMQRKRDIQKKEALAAKINAAKKPVPKAVNRNNKPINRANTKSTKKPSKSTNRPTTKKPNAKPKNNANNKRTKREVNLNNMTDFLKSKNISDMSLYPTGNVQTANEQVEVVEAPTTTNIIDDIATTNAVYTNTNYYEYSVHEVNTENASVKNYTERDDAKVDMIIKKAGNQTNNGQKVGKEQFNIANEIPNEVANDIKLTKWSEIKMFQVKENATNLNLNKTKEFDEERFNNVDGTIASPIEDHRKQIIWKDIERKIDRTTKKYSLLRMVNTHNWKNKRGNEINLKYQPGISLSNKIENLRHVLKRLLGEFRGNNSSTLENKRKKTNAIKYLKKFFNKIFFRDSNKTNVYRRMRNNNHTVQMLCESFGPCVINKKDKEILKKKIKELNIETIQILKSLRIIKGLLRLVDIPDDTTISSSIKTLNFKKDIHKLNIILKRSFDNNKDQEDLSETQRNQINYIKKNTQVFTQSVAKFTKILNDVIDLISVKSSTEKAQKRNSESKSNHCKRNMKKADSIKKFKQLLKNYNIVHNAFLAKIINMLTGLQSNHNVVTPRNNNTVDVTGSEYHSGEVIKNLNKLKNLASALNPSRRQKRHTMRPDNAVEYLLMLMEYMFQQNQLDSSPVNDGIDLLIEAIKNAPDIKSVKKKVLNSNPVRGNEVEISGKNISDEDSMSDNNISGEDNATKITNEDNIVNKISDEDSKSIINVNDNSSSIDQGESIDEENEPDMQLLNLSNGNPGAANEHKETKIKNPNGPDDINNTTVYRQRSKIVGYQKENNKQSSNDMPTKVYMAEGDALGDFDSRLEKASGELSKKTGMYHLDLDDENNVEETLGSTQTVTEKNELTDAITNSYKSLSKTATAKSNTVTKEIRPKLDKRPKVFEKTDLSSSEWINDVRKTDYSESSQVTNRTLDQSPRKASKVKNKNVTATLGEITKNEKPVQIFEIDLSDASKEESDEKTKFKIKKGEDVMVKKEQELLNSLDYGTEPSILEDSDSKDGVEEKFLNDYFAE